MQYTIILTREPDLQWRAFVPGWPECTALSSTRDGVLVEIRRKLADAVSRSEIVRLDLPLAENKVEFHSEDGLSEEWSDYGIFSNDPTWKQLFTEIEKDQNQRRTGD